MLKLVRQLLRRSARTGPREAADLATAVDEARRDYHAAQVYFETVSETELVDQAIHLVSAAEKRLLYLLRKAAEDDAAERPAAGRALRVP